jgi:AbiU2
VLIGDVQIALSKLTDPARTGANENLSLEQLQERVEKQGEPSLQDVMRQILDELKQKCAPFRTWRNKRLAHLDLTTAMKSTANPLPGVSRKMVEEALELVRKYLNAIQIHYEKSETGYEHFIMTTSDGEALISMLKYGLRYEQLIQERKITLNDWEESDWKDA